MPPGRLRHVNIMTSLRSHPPPLLLRRWILILYEQNGIILPLRPSQSVFKPGIFLPRARRCRFSGGELRLWRHGVVIPYLRPVPAIRKPQSVVSVWRSSDDPVRRSRGQRWQVRELCEIPGPLSSLLLPAEDWRVLGLSGSGFLRRMVGRWRNMWAVMGPWMNPTTNPSAGNGAWAWIQPLSSTRLRAAWFFLRLIICWIPTLCSSPSHGVRRRFRPPPRRQSRYASLLAENGEFLGEAWSEVCLLQGGLLPAVLSHPRAESPAAAAAAVRSLRQRCLRFLRIDYPNSGEDQMDEGPPWTLRQVRQSARRRRQ